jgi:hypothetical protein
MLLPWGLVEMTPTGVQTEDHLHELVALSEHEIALIENEYRDWMWLEHGKLVNYR